MKKNYVVTEKLKKLLNGCMPNEYMEEIRNLKYLTMLKSFETSSEDVSISFMEIYGGGWNYSKDFLEELLKNPKVSKTMEIE